MSTRFTTEVLTLTLGWWNNDIPVGGVFMASNVSDTCKIWPVRVMDTTDITDRYGQVGRGCFGSVGVKKTVVLISPYSFPMLEEASYLFVPIMI